MLTKLALHEIEKALGDVGAAVVVVVVAVVVLVVAVVLVVEVPLVVVVMGMVNVLGWGAGASKNTSNVTPVMTKIKRKDQNPGCLQQFTIHPAAFRRLKRTLAPFIFFSFFLIHQ